MIDSFLTYNAHFDRDKGLDYGRLAIASLSGGTRKDWIWVATSSYSTKQYPESFHQRGGIIPPEYRVPGLKNWEVETTPIDLTHIKGVNGNFYRILPFEVTTDKGGKRSDLGIHLDANVPGSMGCIVMNKKRFIQFEKSISIIRGFGVKKIPMFVRLS